jgi:hypothetical protein
MADWAFDVFLSHASADLALTRSLAEWLRLSGFRVWLAEEQLVPGTRFRSGLEQGLRESQHLVAVVTAEYVTRPWTQRELDLFDLAADTTARRIVAIQFGILPTSPLDQVLQVSQRVTWNGSEFEPEAFWLVSCGLRGLRPGPHAEWADKGTLLVRRRADDSPVGTVTSGFPAPPGFSLHIVDADLSSDSSSTIDGLVRQCLKGTEFPDSFRRLRKVLQDVTSHRLEGLVPTLWGGGRTHEAAVVALAMLPNIRDEHLAWSLLDLGCLSEARSLLLLLSLEQERDSEIWFSWAIAEGLWPYLNVAAGKAPPRIQRSHFAWVATVAADKRLTFEEAENQYNYGNMITVWNHFHLTWLAIRLGNLDAAALHAIALCETAVRGDRRAGRFLNRLGSWPTCATVLEQPRVIERVAAARAALALPTLSTLATFRSRVSDLWSLVVASA